MEQLGGLLSVGQRWSLEPFERVGDADAADLLRLTAIHDPPYLSISQRPDGSYSYDGYLYRLWQIIARKLKLRYSIVPLLGGGFGNLAENGTWTGMVGEVAYGRADAALTGIIFRPDRKTVVDFIDAVAVSQDRPTFYVRQGSGDSSQLTAGMFDSLLKPLHVHVWWLLLVSLLLTSLVLRVTVRFNHTRAERRQTVEELSWCSCLLCGFMTLVNQGWARTPDSLAARTATLASWSLGMIVYHTYTANLISHLTVTTVNRPISSLREFAEQPGWVLAMEPGYGIVNNWKTSSDAYERELYDRTVTGEGYIRLDIASESVQRTTEPRVMTYIDIERLLSFVGSEACHLVALLENLPPKSSNYMVISKRRYNTRRAINQLMQHLNQAGIISKLKKTWLKSGTRMCELSQSSKALAIGDLSAVLIIVPIAVVFGTIIFTLEWLHSRSSFRHPRPLPIETLASFGRRKGRERHRVTLKRTGSRKFSAPKRARHW